MKKLLLILACLCSLQCGAQALSLPYHSGFDNATQQKGWEQFRLGFEHTYTWGYNGFNYQSAPYSLYHDYPVEGNAGDTLDDWFASPAVKMANDAKLHFKYNLYTITGSTMPTDYFGVWFSKGSKDPDDGDYVEVVNLTEKANSDFNNWMDTTIDLPDGADSGYVAFRYRADQNWFTINVDDMDVTSQTTSIQPLYKPEPVVLYPNPLKNSRELTLDAGTALHNATAYIYDINGREVKQATGLNGKTLKLNCRWLDKGAYTFRIMDDTGYFSTGKFVID